MNGEREGNFARGRGRGMKVWGREERRKPLTLLHDEEV